MANLPKVTVGFSDGNLTRLVVVIDGEAALIGSASTLANYGKVYIINSLSDAESQGITVEAEPAAHKEVTEFYQSLGGNQELFLMLVDPALTMTQMLDPTQDSRANKLILAGKGKIAYLGTFKSGAPAGNEFIDTDVAAAVLAAKTFVQYWNTKGYFLRTLIPGYINDESSVTIYAPNTASAGQAGVVLPGTANDKRPSIGAALGWKVKYACNIKLGKTKNGNLPFPAMYIGTKPVDQMQNLDSLAGLGYIVALTYPNRAGFYYGVDNMASTDDYKLLVYGAVIDAAARVAFDYYIDWLESEIDVDADGKLFDNDAGHLEDNIVLQVKANLGDRISDAEANVDRDQVIVPGNLFSISLRIRPKGYFTWINIDLGFTA